MTHGFEGQGFFAVVLERLDLAMIESPIGVFSIAPQVVFDLVAVIN